MAIEANYEPIEQKMKLWRRGHIGFPQEYIEYHHVLAEDAVQDLINRGYTIHRKWMDRDGWMDGMITTFAIIETPSKVLKKLVWKDSHSKGSWFEQQRVGSSPYTLEGIEKDYISKQNEAKKQARGW